MPLPWPKASDLYDSYEPIGHDEVDILFPAAWERFARQIGAAGYPHFAISSDGILHIFFGLELGWGVVYKYTEPVWKAVPTL